MILAYLILPAALLAAWWPWQCLRWERRRADEIAAWMEEQ